MSFSVDDLISSFNSNHIGQEQHDLAALQAQLSQVLSYPSTAASPSSNGYRHGSNTPISRTPINSSFNWERADFERRRSNSVAGRGGFEEQHFEPIDAMEDDERMVEDLLFPSSPVASSATPAQFALGQIQPASPSHFSMHSRKSSLSTPYSQMHYDNPPPNSVFATTDPFYLAQLQATQNPPPTSFFAQYGKPAQSSPFMKAHQYQTTHGHPFSHHSEAQTATAFVR